MRMTLKSNSKNDNDFWTQLISYVNEDVDISADEINNSEHFLAKFLKKAEDDRKLLDQQFFPGNSVSVINQLKTTVKQANILLKQHGQLQTEERKLSIEIKTHEDLTETLAQDFRINMKRLNEMKKTVYYMKCLEQFQRQSENLKRLLEKNQMYECIGVYENLINLTEIIKDTSSEHLRNYSENLTAYWYEQLKVKLSVRMEELLKSIQYPYINRTSASILNDLFTSYYEEFKQCFHLILRIRLPTNSKHTDTKSKLRFPGWKPLPLFILFLIQPLKKRFLFHFYGDKKTNNMAKPEWFLNQITSWIIEHNYFLSVKIQPILVEFQYSHINAKIEFIRGLLELVVAKIDSEMTFVLTNTTTFKHYVQEILIFSQRLYDTDCDYPKDLPSCMNLLCDEVIFEKWYQLEQDTAKVRLREIFQSSTAFTSVYDKILEKTNDDLKIPECAETFLTLLHAMEDRYRYVPYPSCALRLLSLEIDVINEYHRSIISSDSQQQLEPLSKQFCSLLNSIGYVADVIEQWRIKPYVAFENKYGISRPVKENEQIDEIHDNMRLIIDPTLAQQFDLTQPSSILSENTLVTKDNSETVLDIVLKSYRNTQEQYCDSIISHTLKILKSKSRRYIKERWSSFPNAKDYFSMNVLPSCSEILLEIQFIFSTLSTSLMKTIYHNIFQKILKKFDEFLFSCVIQDNSFNEGGAAQFLYDLNKGWLRVCNEYFPPNEILLFIRCRESAILLTMPVGSALLLKDTLVNQSSSTNSRKIGKINSPLNELGIHHLNENEVQHVLERRTDLANL